MNMKQCKVIMLPTGDVTKITSSNNRKTLNFHPGKCQNEFNTNQHLYLVSDDNIEGGDWHIRQDDPNNVFLYKKDYQPFIFSENRFKVIATTNSSIKIPYDGKTPISENWGGYELPQIPDLFLSDYVHVQGKIDEVMVEMEEYAFGSYGLSDGEPNIVERVKIQKNGTCIIHPAKTYTRSEVKKLLLLYNLQHPQINPHGGPDFDNWIEKNL